MIVNSPEVSVLMVYVWYKKCVVCLYSIGLGCNGTTCVDEGWTTGCFGSPLFCH